MTENGFGKYCLRRCGRGAFLHAGLAVLILIFSAGIVSVSGVIGRGGTPVPKKEEPLLQAHPQVQTEISVPVEESAVRPQLWNTAVPFAGEEPAPVTQSDSRFLAVPENGRVSNDYFRDALFIGDSVTQGFGWYAEFKDWMRVCAYKGTNPRSVMQNYEGIRPDTVTRVAMWDDIASQKNVSNIYILFGSNALLQQTDEAFLASYGALLDMLRAQFPEVPVYVQSITPTTQARGERQPQLARDHLRQVNNAVAGLAVSRGMYYVDLWETFADENGYLRAELAGGDGLHLWGGEQYRPWLDYLAAHTVYSAHNAQFAMPESGIYA